MAEKILIVDDDRNICEILEFNLSNEGYQVECAYSGEEALKKLASHYSLILLDVMMGGISGYKMAEKLRKDNNHIPIIFLTAKDTENDMLTGFSVGGDDYISKPFSIKEVIARVKAIIKRTKSTEEKENLVQQGQIIYNNIVIDLEAKELLIDGNNIVLTKTEFELLTLLAQKPDKILSRDDIIKIVWHETPYITERTVDVHIARLRKKMGKYGSAIVNRSGYGYKFNTDEIEI
ncbi:MAG: response regulator transcription factor [Paludibacter sp.]|nr:response regulator transcription factor [Paludibacter sp.]